MTDLADLILPRAVVQRLTAPTRKLAIQSLSQALADAAQLDARRVFTAVLMRERLSGTGVGGGVAIPHATMDGLERPIGAFARLDPAADFKAIDGRPADLIFMLLTPHDRSGDHLRALARISRFFKKPETRERLRAARSGDELLALFGPGLAIDAA
jgi:PTS system nitrogen regulatory IIA component